MQIERAARRQGQDRRWHDLAVIGQYEHLGCQVREGLDGFGTAQSIGRERRQSQCVGSRLHGRGRQEASPPGRPGRRADDSDDVGHG